MTQTYNPAGSPKIKDTTPAAPPTPPSPDVVEKQDPKQTEGDFQKALTKATRRKSS